MLSRLRCVVSMCLASMVCSLGCGADRSEICEQYVSCVAIANPTELGEALSVYGRDGACWKSLPSTTCEQVCESGLASLRKLPKVAGLCGTHEPSDPPMNTMDPKPLPPLYAWPFPAKTETYSERIMELSLAEKDPSGTWGCKREAELPPNLFKEPNDTPSTASLLANPLNVDLMFPVTGDPIQICPDQAEPLRPDHDAYLFQITKTSKVIAELSYKVANGDLDLAIFRSTGDGVELVASDMTANDDACIEVELTSGMYYAVVRGAAQPSGLGYKHATAMNGYNRRVMITEKGYRCRPR